MPNLNESDDAEDREVEQEHEDQYKSFLKPYGQVLLDPDLDLEPQVLHDPENSPVYSEIYDSLGNIVTENNVEEENYPSSWDDDVAPKQLEIALIKATHEYNDEVPSWSDVGGQSLNSSFEFWKAKNKFKLLQNVKKRLKCAKVEKYASDSNINDANLDMTEPGLRKIPKEAIYSTTASSEYDNPAQEHVYYSINEDLDVEDKSKTNPDESNIYESVEFGQESGFFSISSAATAPSNVTCISVNQRPESSSSSDYSQCSKVTVNGKVWINPSTSSSVKSPDFAQIVPINLPVLMTMGQLKPLLSLSLFSSIRSSSF